MNKLMHTLLLSLLLLPKHPNNNAAKIMFSIYTLKKCDDLIQEIYLQLK